MRKIKAFNVIGGAGAPEFWTAWLDALARAGFEVEEVFAVSSHAYRSARSRGARLRLRWQMYVGMIFRVLWAGLSSPRDSLLIASTSPFYTPWLLATLTHRRCKVVNLLYDLYPDALVASDKIKATGLIARMFASLTRAALRKSQATVFLGKRIEQHAEQRYGAATVSRVIPVGADCQYFACPPGADIVYPVEVLYCGNLGVLHETEALLHGLRAVGEGARSSVHFRFHASGPCLKAFVEAVQHNGLSELFTFSRMLDNQAWRAAMLRVPIGLVLLKDAARFSAVPSKVYSAMAAGQAILAVCPRESDLADIIIEHDCGWVVDPADATAFPSALRQILEDPACVAAKRTNAYRAAQEHFCMDVVAQAWKALLDAL